MGSGVGSELRGSVVVATVVLEAVVVEAAAWLVLARDCEAGGDAATSAGETVAGRGGSVDVAPAPQEASMTQAQASKSAVITLPTLVPGSESVTSAFGPRPRMSRS